MAEMSETWTNLQFLAARSRFQQNIDNGDYDGQNNAHYQQIENAFDICHAQGHGATFFTGVLCLTFATIAKR